jgi:tetratricopeptide (TPR) repeat protein
MFCLNCGANLVDESKFCPKCGTKVISAEDFLTSEDDEDDDEDDVNDFNEENFVKSLVDTRLEMECKLLDMSLKDIMGKAGKEWFLSGDSYYIKKNYEKAIEYFEKHNKLNKNDFSQFRIAQSYYELARQAKDKSLSAYFEKIESAIKGINKLVPVSNKAKFKIFWLKGDTYHLESDYYKQLSETKLYKSSILNEIEAYSEALKVTTVLLEKSILHFGIGYNYYIVDHYKESLENCLQVISLNPDPKEDKIKALTKNSIEICILCYKNLGDYKNTAIMLSNYLRDNQDKKINKELLEIEDMLDKKGYGKYFNTD